MASIVLLRNPLAPHTREMTECPAGTAVIDWLQAEYPAGFGMPIKFYVNGEEKELDDLDYVLGQDDVAVIALMPAAPLALGPLGLGLLLSAALAAVSYFVMKAFAPKPPGKMKGESTIYNVSSDQNSARIGQPLPVVYGKVLTTPDYISQPYTTYEFDTSAYNVWYSGVQYMYILLCVGQGDVDVNEVVLADTQSKTLPTDTITWRAFKPSEHGGNMGVIQSATGINENMITSPEVGNQEFVDANDAAGPFVISKVTTKTRQFEVDIVFPSGLTNPDNDGNIKGRSTQFQVIAYEVDDNDNRVGADIVWDVYASSQSSAGITGRWSNVTKNTSQSAENQTVISGPLRRTYFMDPGKVSRWAVRIVKITDSPKSKNGSDRFVWAALRGYGEWKNGVYANCTILAVKVKATLGLGTDASVRISCWATRRLAPVGGGSVQPTTSGADAFADIYTNAIYGANRPTAELDVAYLKTLRSKWNGYQFNYVFKDATTVWEALRTVTAPFNAEPNPIGAMMSVAEDAVKPVRSMLFTDANIVEDTMSVSYSFDEEGAPTGVEIEYLDPRDFKNVFVQYPANAATTEKYMVPGITVDAHAAQYARLMWNKKQFQRKTVAFDTELEGLLLQMGDRIGISHNVPKWGDSGQVIGYAGSNRVIVDHDLDWSGGAKYVLLRARDGSVTNQILVTKGDQPNIMVLQSTIPIALQIDNEYDYTAFAFGTAANIVQDFTVLSVRPNDDNRVTIEAANYSTSVFTGAMSFLGA